MKTTFSPGASQPQYGPGTAAGTAAVVGGSSDVIKRPSHDHSLLDICAHTGLYGRPGGVPTRPGTHHF